MRHHWWLLLQLTCMKSKMILHVSVPCKLIFLEFNPSLSDVFKLKYNILSAQILN